MNEDKIPVMVYMKKDRVATLNAISKNIGVSRSSYINSIIANKLDDK